METPVKPPAAARAQSGPSSGLASGAAGITLIELLIAAAVLAILAVGATLSVGRSASPSDSDQSLFQRNFALQRQLAVTGQQSRGLKIEPGGLRRATRRTQDSTLGWHISDTRQRWRGTVVLIPNTDTTLATPRGVEIPELIFLANGQTTPFEILFRQDSSSIRCSADGWGDLTCGG